MAKDVDGHAVLDVVAEVWKLAVGQMSCVAFNVMEPSSSHAEPLAPRLASLLTASDVDERTIDPAACPCHPAPTVFCHGAG